MFFIFGLTRCVSIVALAKPSRIKEKTVLQKKRSLMAAGIVALTAVAGLSTPAWSDDKVVAKVNGQEITEADMTLAESEIGKDLAQLPPEVKRRALAEYLIDNLLFAEAAEEAKLESDAEFENRLRYLRSRLLREFYFEKFLKNQIDEAQAKKIYDDRIAQLNPETEVLVRHILVKDEDKAKEIREKIVAGEDFAELAKENSIDPGSKDKGGLVGYFVKGQMVPEFEQAAFTMIEGSVSEPVKTDFGWHILKLEDRRQKPPPTYEAVKDTIMNSLIVLKAQEKASALRDKAELEYVDVDIKKQVEEQAKKQAEQKANGNAAAPKP